MQWFLTASWFLSGAAASGPLAQVDDLDKELHDLEKEGQEVKRNILNGERELKLAALRGEQEAFAAPGFVPLDPGPPGAKGG